MAARPKKAVPPKFDVLSKDFDPVAALQQPDKVVLPFPKVYPMDNISMCSKLLIDEWLEKQQKDKKEKEKERKEKERKEKEAAPASSRLRQDNSWSGTVVEVMEMKEGMRDPMVNPTNRRRSQGRLRVDVIGQALRNMEKGPMSLMVTSFKEKTRVRVVVRRIKGVFGTCEGFIEAFDKHFNMVLTDVLEEYKIAEYKDREDEAADLRAKLAEAANHDESSDEGEALSPLRPPLPRRRVLVPVRRHVAKLFLRGDGVVMVSRVP